MQAHYENSALQIREVVEKTGLNFPNIPVEVIIHPFFNHPAARASLNARFDRIIITVPYQWMIEKKLRGKFVVIPNTPIRTLGAFYHEFGHAIFRFNSEKSESSLLSEYYQIKRKFVNLTTRIIELRSRLNKKNLSTDQINAQTSEEKGEWLMLKDHYDKITNSDAGKIINGLDEFFADAVAVVISKNPHVISDIFTINSKKSGEDYDQARDFSNPKNSIRQFEGEWDDPHDYFAPARFHLYKKYLSVGRYSPSILFAVFKAIENVTATLSIEQDLDLFRLNNFLIEALDNQLSVVK
ncbi:MAG: hypothetical protein ACK4VO_03115 [Pseudobdellovibrio sp.]